MVVQHQILQLIFQHMGVNLGGRKIGMAEEGLNNPQISAMRQQVRGKGMALI
jgi:hypothetical protein